MDPTKHATGVLEDKYGRVLGKIHIASNPADQQVFTSSLLTAKTNVDHSRCDLKAWLETLQCYLQPYFSVCGG